MGMGAPPGGGGGSRRSWVIGSGLPGSHLGNGGKTELLGERTPPGAPGGPAGRGAQLDRPRPAWKVLGHGREGERSKQGSGRAGDAFQAGSSAQARPGGRPAPPAWPRFAGAALPPPPGLRGGPGGGGAAGGSESVNPAAAGRGGGGVGTDVRGRGCANQTPGPRGRLWVCWGVGPALRAPDAPPAPPAEGHGGAGRAVAEPRPPPPAPRPLRRPPLAPAHIATAPRSRGRSRLVASSCSPRADRTARGSGRAESRLVATSAWASVSSTER